MLRKTSINIIKAYYIWTIKNRDLRLVCKYEQKFLYTYKDKEPSKRNTLTFTLEICLKKC